MKNFTTRLAFPVLVAFFVIFSVSNSYAFNSCQCTTYAKCATGLNITGDGKDWDNNAGSKNKVGSTPIVGGAMNFEKGAYGADSNHGHVGKVMSYKSDGSYWKVTVRHANWSTKFSNCGCDNVSEKEFRVKKGDSQVHYITKK